MKKNAPLEDNMFWSDFENSLSKLDDYYMDNTISMLESQIEGIKYIDNDWRNDLFYNNLDVYGQLQDGFMKWVELIESEVDKVNKKNNSNNIFNYEIFEDEDGETSCVDFFIVFNYTHTLEMVYDIPRENIIRPHGEGGKNTYCLPEFGHNDDLMISEYKERLLDTSSDLEKEYYRWAIEYLEQTRKDVSFHIDDIKQFMKWNIVDLTEIVVIGMSFGKVDLLYFKEINNLFPNIKWIITYYCDGEDEHIRDILNILGVASDFIEFINLKFM